MPQEAIRKCATCVVGGAWPEGSEAYRADLALMVEVAVGNDARSTGGYTDPRRARAAAQAYLDRHTRTPGYRLEATAALAAPGSRDVVVAVTSEEIRA
jgi:hypothetical protein